MRRTIVVALAFSGVLIGLASLASYVLDIPVLRRWNDPPMAVNTALVCFVVGLAILFISNGGNGK